MEGTLRIFAFKEEEEEIEHHMRKLWYDHTKMERYLRASRMPSKRKIGISF